MEKKFLKKWENWFNNIELKTKMAIVYIACILIPLVVTDSFILYTVNVKEKQQIMQQDKEVADSVQALLNDFISYSETISSGISRNSQINAFLSKNFKDAHEYYSEYVRFMNNSFFESMTGFENTKITLYSDNSTMSNGGHVIKLKSVINAPWYKELQYDDRDIRLLFVFDNWENKQQEERRKIYFLRKFNGGYNSQERFMRIEVDYSTTSRKLMNQMYDRGVYLCKDDRILLSNEINNNLTDDYIVFEKYDDVSYVQSFVKYGDEYQIYIMKSNSSILDYLKRNFAMLIVVLGFSIMLPILFIIIFNYTIVTRLQKVEQAFKNSGEDNLTKIEEVEGTDEIGSLMSNYNIMADRINELIQIVYKNKLIEHENNIARQKAELLALHSQINPHFLFNALESIRMHSIIKNEDTTAEMVAKLAMLERQYVEWGDDLIEVSKEIKFVEAYLELQKYRFGDRLSYEIDVDDDCMDVRIPKLTIVTFAENACVHGIESKSSNGWVFVRVHKSNEKLVIEVEDTGGGMDEATVANMLEEGRNVSIEKIKNKKHVGVYNALLRLKIFTDDKSEFVIESEEGVGTLVQIII
ncbi:MAG: histidine kinase [Lachnospiraceae bacterium]|nr:histidine kinase [Lachnospiraceae bacterium]